MYQGCFALILCLGMKGYSVHLLSIQNACISREVTVSKSVTGTKEKALSAARNCGERLLILFVPVPMILLFAHD